MPFGKDFIKESLKRAIDALNRFLLVVLLLLIIITLFVRNFYLDILKFIILIVVIFRLTSKNKFKRNKENEFFLKVLRGMGKPFNNIVRNFKDRTLCI